MVKNWLRRIAERKAPTAIFESKLFQWVLLDLRLLKISLWAATRSTTEGEQFTVSRSDLLYVVDGTVVLRYEYPFESPKPANSYRVCGPDGWGVTHVVEEGQFIRFHAGESFEVELLSARTMEEKLFDLPQWMTTAQVQFDTERQAWFLSIEWGRRRARG